MLLLLYYWIVFYTVSIILSSGRVHSNTHYPATSIRQVKRKPYLLYSIAFAGGFAKNKNNENIKTRNKINKETKHEHDVSTSNKDKKRARLFIDQDETQKKSVQPPPVLLDRFGLPVVTAENFFPPLPQDTEMIRAIDINEDRPILYHIQEALKSHIPIHFDLFDEHGVEKRRNHHILSAAASDVPWKLQLLHYSPPVLYIENFLTPEECQECISLTQSDHGMISPQSPPTQVNSATFTSTYALSKRTSTSWFCHYSTVPTFLAKAKRLLHLSSLETFEEPQIVRYRTGEEFSWHYDEVPSSQLDNGGQRVATLLVYLNTLLNHQGGGTIFRDLKDDQGNSLSVQPRIGDALLFFPAFSKGQPDDRTLHKGEVALSEKRILQMWIHERKYQAVLPKGNTQEEAIPSVLSKEKELGYTNYDR